jgi:hypothetical protein
MTTETNTTELLTAAWQDHDRWALTLKQRTPTNAGQTHTHRLTKWQERAALEHGMTGSELIEQVTQQRRAGHDLPTAIERALAFQPALPPW